MNPQKIEFQRYRDFGQIINATFEFIKQNFGPLLKSLIFIVGPFLLIIGILSGFYQKNIFSFYNFTSLYSFGFSIIIIIVGMFITFQMMLSTTYSFLNIYLARTEFQRIQIEEVWIGIKLNFLKLLGLTISIGLFFLIVFILFVLVVSYTISSETNPFLVFIIFSLYSIPLFYIGIKMSLVYIVSIYENTGVIASIQRSFYLTKNKWWFTFGLIFVLFLIEAFMGFVFQIPQYIIMFATIFNAMDGTGIDAVTEIIIIVTSIISTFQYLLYVISLIALAFHYFSLVEQKEAKGLLDKIEAI